MSIRRIQRSILYFLLLLSSTTIFALTLPLPSHGNDIVGHTRVITINRGTNITKLGQNYSVGYLEFLEANPGVNINNLYAGEKLVVPTRFLLPNAPRKGIVINIAELRLYYFPAGRHEVVTFPVGIGRSHTKTPTFQSYIRQKRKHPTWIPTKDTRIEADEKGIHLPPYILPGPENPLGDYAMRIGYTTYLIHGTNNPSGVGIRSSGGCIRMYPQDIKKLFAMVPLGTPVNIVNQPFKAGWQGNKLYLEAHVPEDFKRYKAREILAPVIDVLMPFIKHWKPSINWDRVVQIADMQQGLPYPIGRRG